MRNSVIIKGNKYGFQIVLNPELPFEELLTAVAAKFRESASFFRPGSSIAVSFAGRELTAGEEDLLVDTITEDAGLHISCVIDGAKEQESLFARALGLADCPPDTKEFGNALRDNIEENGRLYRGTLRSGQTLEAVGSVVILGDVNPGAQVVAGGNVIVLGSLKGTAHAGYPEDQAAFIMALLMEPIQLQIGTYIARSPDAKEKPQKKRIRKKRQPESPAKLALVEDGNIFIETVTKSLISEIGNKEARTKEKGS